MVRNSFPRELLAFPSGLLTLRLPNRDAWVMPVVRMTKTLVEKLQPKGAETIYWDDALPGFGVRVKTSGSRATSSNTATALTAAPAG